MDLREKLQLKSGQNLETVLAPESVISALAEPSPSEDRALPAGLIVFVVGQSGLEEQRARIVTAATSGRLTWVAYPKSGQLARDLNRDSLAALLDTSGIRPVRQIAIDGIWSALRFRG